MSIDIPGRPARAALFVAAIILAIVACSRERTASSPSTIALVTDPAALDNALARCNQSSASVEAEECRSVRAALARLADERRKTQADQDRHAEAQAQAKFEAERDALRRRHDAEKASREQEASKQADPYTMPFVPPESPGKAPAPASQPTPAPAAPAEAASEKIVAAASDEDSTLRQ